MRKILKSQSQYSTKVGMDCGNVVGVECCAHKMTGGFASGSCHFYCLPILSPVSPARSKLSSEWAGDILTYHSRLICLKFMACGRSLKDKTKYAVNIAP